MKTSAPKTINGITYHRVAFRLLSPGDEIYQMESDGGGTPALLGIVNNIEATPHGTAAVDLNSGNRLTERGWQSKRLWVKQN